MFRQFKPPTSHSITRMKASVLITTLNHQRWLSGAIDSVLKQKTSFDFEIVIGVDLSDDRTLETA